MGESRRNFLETLGALAVGAAELVFGGVGSVQLDCFVPVGAPFEIGVAAEDLAQHGGLGAGALAFEHEAAVVAVAGQQMPGVVGCLRIAVSAVDIDEGDPASDEQFEHPVRHPAGVDQEVVDLVDQIGPDSRVGPRAGEDIDPVDPDVAVP